jgi:hypothetical protein
MAKTLYIQALGGSDHGYGNAGDMTNYLVGRDANSWNIESSGIAM